jgi:hypothetical protein
MKKLYRCPFWDKCDENPEDALFKACIAQLVVANVSKA